MVSVMPYMLISRGKPGVIVQPGPKTLGFKGFAAEDHRLELELTAQLGGERIGRLQRVKGRRGLAQHRDLFGNQQRVELFRRAHH